MKYSIATILTVIAVVAVPSVDAVVGDITGGNEISSVSSSEPLHVSRNAATSRNGGTGRHKKKGKSDKSPKAKNFIGDCSVLSGAEFEITTGWEVDSELLYTYPCSGGYAPNFAANDQLLKDVRGAINNSGRSLGIDADCANLCDVDNGSYELVGGDAITGRVSVADVYPSKIANIFCEPVFGILNEFNPARDDAFNNGPNNDLNACRCDPDNKKGGGKYISGCNQCEGSLKFKVKSCLNSSGFKKSEKK